MSASQEGRWFELLSLASETATGVYKRVDWDKFWRGPIFPELEFHREAAEALLQASHMQQNVLVAGPQGSGKTTWAKALYALSAPPLPTDMNELQEMFGEEGLVARWRPLQNPHHTIPALSMIGGGIPLRPGVISRAHGGILIMDEFLQFDPY